MLVQQGALTVKFSIVVPSYNQATFLPACLDGLLWQDGVDVEILVYDGGSTDGSKKIIEKYADRIACWQSQPDGGQAAALKVGFERATGDILGWLNADDVLFPNTVKHIAAYYETHPDTVFVYGDAVWIDHENRVIRPKREIDFNWSTFAYGYCYIPQPSAFFRRDAYEKAGGVDPSYKCCMDYDLWHRLARIGPVGHIPVFVSGIRDHPGTKTNTLKDVFAQEHDILCEKYLHCSRPAYKIRHVMERCRRVCLRLVKARYRSMTTEEVKTCGLNL